MAECEEKKRSGRWPECLRGKASDHFLRIEEQGVLAASVETRKGPCTEEIRRSANEADRISESPRE